MDKASLAILTNIIGAVESGGQIYGKRNYGAYAGKGQNSSNEKTCTLGWAQNYGNEGRTLCKMILAKDPVAFRKADTAGIENKLAVDWVKTGWNPSEKEKKALIAIITTSVGKECQDVLFKELMATYIKSAEAFGVTGMVGEDVILYWMHNSEDGSSQTYAEIELTENGTLKTMTIKNSTDEDEKDLTSYYILDTSKYNEGAVIQWRVRTKGVIDQYGDWSIQRRIDIYAPPTLELETNGSSLDVITSFPYSITATAGPESQKPIGYQMIISANEGYDALDFNGKEKRVSAGDEVYSKYFNASEDHRLSVTLNASDIDLENNISYTIYCVVSMDSGLTAEATLEFSVAWTDEEYIPDAEIGIDNDTLTAYIRPYCEDEDGYLIDNVVLSVYRREFDGTYTELARDVENQQVVIDEVVDSNGKSMTDSSGKELIGRDANSKYTFITDPHPALDYARYRIVAMSTITGAISYTDIPGYPVGENAAVIQWDEEWTQFDSGANDDGDEMDEPPWSGSMLKLPYNLDVSDKGNTDVTFAKYIGRRHPVSYYGTQIGETSTWNIEVIKDDTETLYALRRLKAYTGDAYVREPSGSGYWANVQVSFNQKHCELTIPVTLDITRVDGGV